MEFRYALLIALLLAVPLASATGNLSSQYLGASAAQVKCKTDFMDGVINSITSNVASASSLSSYSSKLQSDAQQLQTYADNGQADSYRDFLRGTYDPDLKAAREAIVDWRRTPGKNLTNGTRASLLTSYGQLNTQFKGCELDALKQYADAKVNGYERILQAATDRANNLSAKGLDISALTSLISGAQSAIVTPLQSAINSATDAKGIEAAVRSYCLYNGCKDGTNYHFAAKWEIAKLKAIEAKVQAQPKAGNYTSQLSQVTSDLNTASSVLSSIGTSDFGPGQEGQVWSSINDAAKTLTQVIHGMRS